MLFRSDTLAYLAALVRASGVILPLADILPLDELKQSGNCSGDDIVESHAAIVRVIGSFAPDEPVRSAFNRLFLQDALARSAATMFNSLCICAPERYAEYLPRFIQLVREHPDYYEPHIVVDELVHRIGLKTVVDHLHELDSQTLREFAILLTRDPNAPVKIGVDLEMEECYLTDPHGDTGAWRLPAYINSQNRQRCQRVLMALKVEEVLESCLVIADRHLGTVVLTTT